MRTLATCLVLPTLAASALAQLPAPTLVSRTAPRATWAAVTTAGSTTPTGTPPATPAVNTTFRAESCGAASATALWVFGGSLGNNTATVTNDLWAFNAAAGTFTQVQAHGTAGAPPARGRHAAAWNPATNRLVVFGGNTRGATPTLLNDTWEYDPTSNTWTAITPALSPSARQFASMTYDPTIGGILLFGGQTNDASPNVNSSETWVLLGGAWIPLSPATVPAARGQHSLVTRSNFADVLMCGGIDNGIATPEQIRFLDVWTWNGGNWTLISNCDVVANPTGAGTTWPGNVNANQAVYDPLRQRVVVQGGQGITVATNTTYVYGPNYGGSPSNYTSEFDCLTNQWVLYANPTTGASPFNNNDPQIGRVSRYFGGFVASTGKVYKVCGQNPVASGSKPAFNVYQYQASTLASATPYGAGCSGPGGALALTTNSTPWTGRTWTASCSTLAPTSFGLLVWGLGTQSLPLGLVLPGVGGVGCDLLNTAESLLGPEFPIAGTLGVSLAVPPTPTLSGAQLHLQVAELEFTFLGLTGVWTSNGISITVGAL